MGWLPLTLSGKRVHICKAFRTPHFGGMTILVDDPWDYVEMWLRRNSSKKALFYWSQARAFCEASQGLPKSASPLTTYYSALNAVKALLISKNVNWSESHGVAGNTGQSATRTSLANEIVYLKSTGVLPEFCKYLGESPGEARYRLKDILYNLPFVHRAYCVTFPRAPELFIPISDPIFVRQENSDKCCFRCAIRDRKDRNSNTLRNLAGFEAHQEASQGDAYLIRLKKRFSWKEADAREMNLGDLSNYHHALRKRTAYIKGISRLWYLKRSSRRRDVLDRCSMTLTFMAMHRLSELSRYTPDRLARHFDCQHNYLLSEFLSRGIEQFIDEIAAELTGDDFMLPGYAGK